MDEENASEGELTDEEIEELRFYMKAGAIFSVMRKEVALSLVRRLGLLPDEDEGCEK